MDWNVIQYNPMEKASAPRDSGIPAESDDIDGDDFKERLKLFFNTACGPAKFAIDGFYDQSPNPGLYIQDIGPIGLPLSKRDAETIISKSRQSPFSKGNEILVDTSVQNSWELSRGEFVLQNPAWDAFISNILSRVHRELGLTCHQHKINAELYNLLLYEADAFFKAHQDSRNTPSIFGTLIVCLPSPHEGGRVLFSHNKETKAFVSAAHANFEVSFAAWYTDVYHSLEPVTSGHRLVLTYNLVQWDSKTPQAAPDGGMKSKLTELLRYYENSLAKDIYADSCYIAHKLSHYYTETSMNLDVLNRPDYCLVQLLQDVCKTLCFDIFLATFEKTSYQDPDDPGTSLDTQEEFKNVIRLDGTPIKAHFTYKEESVLWEVEEEMSGDADESEHEGPETEEGWPVTLWYRETVVILVPPSRKIDIQLKNASVAQAISVIESLKAKAKAKTDEFTKFQLLRQCRCLLEKVTSKSSHREEMECKDSIAMLALEFDDIGLLKQAAGDRELPSKVLHSLAQACINSASTIGFDEARGLILSANSIETKWKVLSSFANAFAALFLGEKTPAFDAWFSETLSIITTGTPFLRKYEGTAMAEILLDDRTNIYETLILKGVLQSSVGALVRFAIKLHDGNNNSEYSDKSDALYKTLVTLWSNFSFTLHIDPLFMKTDELNVVELSELVQISAEASPSTAIECFTALKEASKEVSCNYIHSTIFPFLKHTVESELVAIQSTDTRNPKETIADFVTAILYLFILKHVRSEPKQPRDWSLPAFSQCPCEDCTEVNSFMTNPNETLLNLRYSKSRRKHLDEQFRDFRRAKSFTLDTVRTGTPYAWQMKKNMNEYYASHQRWKTKREEARKTLKWLGGEDMSKLRIYLGSYFHQITSCTLENLPKYEEVFRQPLGNAPAAGNSSAQKRKEPADADENHDQQPQKRIEVENTKTTEFVDLT